MPFLTELERSEMIIALSRNRSRVTVSISYDDNTNAKRATVTNELQNLLFTLVC